MIPRFIIEKLRSWQPRWSPMGYKATLVGMVSLAFVVPLALVALPFVEFFNGMAAQPKGKAQGTYGRRAGLALVVERPPVAGTIPRSYVAYPYEHLGNTIEDAREAGAQLENPLPVSRESLYRGQKAYNTYCLPCHGRQGEGDGPVTGPGRFPAPPSLHTVQARKYADGTIYHVITKGMGKMPSYRAQLEPEERWEAVHYVRALQRAMNPQPEDLER